MKLDSTQKKYATRFAEFLTTQPDSFRFLVERVNDKRYSITQAWQIREIIEKNYDTSNFDLFDHLPDDFYKPYLFAVFVRGYEILGDAKLPVADVAYEWVNHKAISKSYVAAQMGMTPQTFDKKLKEIGANKFSIEEIVKLAQVREQIIEQLRPQVVRFDDASLS